MMKTKDYEHGYPGVDVSSMANVTFDGNVNTFLSTTVNRIMEGLGFCGIELFGNNASIKFTCYLLANGIDGVPAMEDAQQRTRVATEMVADALTYAADSKTVDYEKLAHSCIPIYANLVQKSACLAALDGIALMVASSYVNGMKVVEHPMINEAYGLPATTHSHESTGYNHTH